jgi:hypothetical protein
MTLNRKQYQTSIRVITCLLNTSKSLQTQLTAAVHLAERRILMDGPTENKGKPRSFRVRTRRPIMSMEDGQDLEPPQKHIKSCINIIIITIAPLASEFHARRLINVLPSARY